MIFSLAVFTYIQFIFQLKKKEKIKNGFTTFFLFTFLISSSLFSLLSRVYIPSPPPVPSSIFFFSPSLSFSIFLVRFLASDLRNPFKLRNTLLSPFFSPLTFSSLLCAPLLRYLSSSHPLDSAVHPPSSPSPFVSHS